MRASSLGHQRRGGLVELVAFRSPHMPLSRRQLTRCTLDSEARNKTLPSPIYFTEAEFKSVNRTGDATMFTKIKLVLAAVLVAGAGSLAQASNENDGGNETGGFVMPGSMDGVNPAYHPRWFPAYSALRRAVDPQAPSNARADSETILQYSAE
jgi:hypothetical protein